MQHLMGVEGAIVDLVQEITEAVSDLTNKKVMAGQEEEEEEGKNGECWQHELSLLLKLIPDFIQP